MPSKSPSQARLMSAVAHGWKPPGGGGPPMDVAEEFNQADKGGEMLHKGMMAKAKARAKALRGK